MEKETKMGRKMAKIVENNFQSFHQAIKTYVSENSSKLFLTILPEKILKFKKSKRQFSTIFAIQKYIIVYYCDGENHWKFAKIVENQFSKIFNIKLHTKNIYHYS